MLGNSIRIADKLIRPTVSILRASLKSSSTTFVAPVRLMSSSSTRRIPIGRYTLVLLPLNIWPIVVAQSFSQATNNDGEGKQAIKKDSAEMTTDYKNAKSIYDFTVKDSFGNDVSLDKYKGNVVLIVNIASKCGLTKNNYAQLTELHEKYQDKGLRILNFPCNQFSSQMPEADGEEMVCHLRDAKANIGDVFKKVDVNGDNADPLWKYLKHKQGGTLGDGIKWNFTKFLVDKNGLPVERFAPTTEPKDIVKYIEKLL